MSNSPEKEPQGNKDHLLAGIPFSRSLTDEQISAFNNLRSQLVRSLEKKDYEFAGELIQQLPRLRGEHFARIIDSLQAYPQLLALFLDLMTPEDLEEYVDVLPEVI